MILMSQREPKHQNPNRPEQDDGGAIEQARQEINNKLKESGQIHTAN